MTDDLSVRFVPVAEFVAVEEEGAEPLVGTRDESLVAAGSDVVLYGDGGAGKTTLSIDLAAHLASGTPWLGFDVPRPVRTLVIENEGPRPKFREKLGRKLATWTGNDWASNVSVLDLPWGRFTLRREEHRICLAEAVTAHDADLVVAGPVKRLGMVGGGTPDEVSTFSALLTEVRALLDRPVSFWLVHHENKAGEVSGAWEGETDTLLHIKPQGKGRSVLEFQKARWAPAAHGEKLTLRWLMESEGFEVVHEVERDYRSLVLAAMSDGDWWSVSRLRKPQDEGGIGATPKYVQAVFDAEPDLFEKASGTALGRSRGTYYRLRGEWTLGPEVHSLHSPTPAGETGEWTPVRVLEKADGESSLSPSLLDAGVHSPHSGDPDENIPFDFLGGRA